MPIEEVDMCVFLSVNANKENDRFDSVYIYQKPIRLQILACAQRVVLALATNRLTIVCFAVDGEISFVVFISLCLHVNAVRNRTHILTCYLEIRFPRNGEITFTFRWLFFSSFLYFPLFFHFSRLRAHSLVRSLIAVLCASSDIRRSS